MWVGREESSARHGIVRIVLARKEAAEGSPNLKRTQACANAPRMISPTPVDS